MCLFLLLNLHWKEQLLNSSYDYYSMDSETEGPFDAAGTTELIQGNRQASADDRLKM